MIQPPASNAYYSQDPVRPTQRPTENNDDRPVQRRKENATNCFDMPLGAWLIVIAYTSIISSFCVCAFTVVQILVEVSNRDAGIWPPVAYDYLFYLVIVVNVIFFVASICLCVDGCAGLQCCRLFFFSAMESLSCWFH
ncbi:hypothetical protein M3Y94_00516800 [Aphelenchoides besseyi]|nr:hypothetical protein M3Y94_00516800 [Aphelenchoides besseyi]